MSNTRGIYRKAVIDARDTFADMEKGLRLLRRDALAESCRIAKEGMDEALVTSVPEQVALDMLGDTPVSALDEIEKVMGDVYALLLTVSLDGETRETVNQLGLVHWRYFVSESQSEKWFGPTEVPDNDDVHDTFEQFRGFAVRENLLESRKPNGKDCESDIEEGVE